MIPQVRYDGLITIIFLPYKKAHQGAVPYERNKPILQLQSKLLIDEAADLAIIFFDKLWTTL